jgi:glycosyltransferase involved in cell wall biosynthesis
MRQKRLSICYAAPGQNLVPTAGPTRNVLSVADALSEWADVTVAFRGITGPVATTTYRVIAIEPQRSTVSATGDDNATRGLHLLDHAGYCRRLRRFARQHAHAYDVVLEKGWRLSGYLLDGFRRRGMPGVLVENNVYVWSEPCMTALSLAKYLVHTAAEWAAGRCSRRASAIIAETEELKTLLVGRRRVPPELIEVVGLGVDHRVFRARAQDEARWMLNIRPDAMLLLYVGAMDEYHDLEPVIEALSSIGRGSIELHVVGDGEFRDRCERKARSGQVAATFHGRVSHSTVPEYIAAADLCIAPYRSRACAGGVVPFSTLKIPEYMACARPVVSVPGGPIQRLVEDGVSGFLFPNEAARWQVFLRGLPSRERLAAMGTAAARAVRSLSWQHTAGRYLEICERVARAAAWPREDSRSP